MVNFGLSSELKARKPRWASLLFPLVRLAADWSYRSDFYMWQIIYNTTNNKKEVSGTQAGEWRVNSWLRVALHAFPTRTLNCHKRSSLAMIGVWLQSPVIWLQSPVVGWQRWPLCWCSGMLWILRPLLPIPGQVRQLSPQWWMVEIGTISAMSRVTGGVLQDFTHTHMHLGIALVRERTVINQIEGLWVV